LVSGPSGAVIKGAEVDRDTAIGRRRPGEIIIVFENSLRANRGLAPEIETAISPCERREPHDTLTGPLAFPHFQQKNRAAEGHSFYETDTRKAKTK
jgi:hypothetical protein